MEHTNKPKNTVTVILSGAVTFKSMVSPTLAAKVIQLCDISEQKEYDPSLIAPSEGSGVNDQKISLAEYVRKYEPTTYPEKILVIASFLRERKGQESFSPEDIRPHFRTMGDIPPANFGRDFRTAIKNAWIAPEEKDPHSYYVTGIGKGALQSNFAPGTVKKRKTRNNARKQKKGAKNRTEA